jgi:hypothetical protein
MLVRYCTFCGKQIPAERVIRSSKAKYCRDECKSEDRHQRAWLKADSRRAKGVCPTCGRKPSGKRQQGTSARVREVA